MSADALAQGDHRRIGPRQVGWIAGAVVAALLMGALGLALFHQSAVPSRTVVGGEAPEVAVRAADGHVTTLSSLRGRPVVMNVWASWCAPCRQEASALNAAARRWDGRVSFLGVDYKDSAQAASAFQSEIRSPYPVGPADGGIPGAYGVSAPPETFFIDAQGIVVAQFAGPIDRPTIDRYLQLAGIRS